MAKIKLEEAQRIQKKISYLESELVEVFKEADKYGMQLQQHRCKGNLDRYEYFLTGVKVYPDDLEI